jgi:xylan 1,4-beta-xylosidase
VLNSDSALLTRRKDGALVVALWNYAPPADPAQPRTFTLRLSGLNARHALISRVDEKPGDGDFHAEYQQLGSPRYPTAEQDKQLRKATELAAPQNLAIDHGQLTVAVPAHGLALIEIR